MKQMKKILYIFIAAAIMSSCVSLDTVQLEVLRPAKNSSKHQYNQISLTNGYLKNNQKKKDDFKNLVKYDKYRIDSLVSVEALRSVYNHVNDAGMTQIKVFDSLGTHKQLRGTVVNLELVDIVSKVETDPVYVNSRNAYYAAVMVPYRVHWEIKQNGRVIDSTYYNDTVWAEGYKKTFEKLADLVRFNEVVLYIIDKTASNFARQISPTWQNVERYYVRSGNNDFHRAAYYMDNKQYDKAAAIWQKYTKSGSRKVAGNALLNLAVYHELKGDVEKALEMASKAKGKGNEMAKKYLSVLEKRQQEINLLLNKR